MLKKFLHTFGFLALFVFGQNSAFAYYASTIVTPGCTSGCVGYRAVDFNTGGGTGEFSSASAACAQSAANGSSWSANYNFEVAEVTTNCSLNLYTKSTHAFVSNSPYSLFTHSVASYPQTTTYACNAGGTLSGNTCTCGAGQVDNGAACVIPPVCTPPLILNTLSTLCISPRATSPLGASAPTNPLGLAPVAIAVSLALAILAAGAVLLAAPLIAGTALGAGALMSALIASPLFYTASTAQGAMNDGSQPVSVVLAPDDYVQDTKQPAAGNPSVVTASSGKFVPGGGGTFTGNGASGGWAPAVGGATGDWQYTPPVTSAKPYSLPTATITQGGFRYSSSSSSGASTVVDRFTDGSITLTRGFNGPVTTAEGVGTTVPITQSTSYGPTGALNPGSPTYAIGPKLGNGAAAGDGSSLTLGTGGATSGQGGGGLGGSCGSPGQPACRVLIDETGTPTTGKPDGTALQDGFTQLNQSIDDIKNPSGKDTSWGVVPSWTKYTGECHSVVLMTLPAKLGSKEVSLNLCPWMPTIYLLMNLLWIVWTFGAVTNMVFRVTTSSGS